MELMFPEIRGENKEILTVCEQFLCQIVFFLYLHYISSKLKK